MCPKRERLWMHNFRCMFLTLFHRISQSARWSSLYCHAKQQCTKKQMKPQQENKKGNTFFPHTNQTNKTMTRQDKAPTKKTKNNIWEVDKKKRRGKRRHRKKTRRAAICTAAVRPDTLAATSRPPRKTNIGGGGWTEDMPRQVGCSLKARSQRYGPRIQHSKRR